jgi:glycosyltransferase involved in cell wall biosynthesis
MPKKVVELELSGEKNPIWGCDRYDWIHILVRYHGDPVGWVCIHNSDWAPVINLERLRYAIADQLGWELVWNMLGKNSERQATDSAPLDSISVVVCTRDRADQLEKCLKALLALDYPNYEVVIVDNAPSNDDTAKLVSDLPVRYVREERPGLDWARNRGISEARYNIIAFTDDDVRPDSRWLRSINAAFTDSEVMAVTGLVAPEELETWAQICYELGYGGLMQGLQCQIFQRELLSRRGLLWASNLGAGANMAFRREIFAAIGPFDVALDVGTPSGSGGDVEMFHRLVARGYTLIYDPRVLVWHLHRRDITALSRQLHDNGLGFGSYLLTCARNRTVGLFSILHFALRDWIGGWILRRLLRPGWFPRHLVLSELAGALRSPLAYRAAQAHAKRVAAASNRKAGLLQEDGIVVAASSLSERAILPDFGNFRR